MPPQEREKATSTMRRALASRAKGKLAGRSKRPGTEPRYWVGRVKGNGRISKAAERGAFTEGGTGARFLLASGLSPTVHGNKHNFSGRSGREQSRSGIHHLHTGIIFKPQINAGSTFQNEMKLWWPLLHRNFSRGGVSAKKARGTKRRHRNLITNQQLKFQRQKNSVAFQQWKRKQKIIRVQATMKTRNWTKKKNWELQKHRP